MANSDETALLCTNRCWICCKFNSNVVHLCAAAEKTLPSILFHPVMVVVVVVTAAAAVIIVMQMVLNTHNSII